MNPKEREELKKEIAGEIEAQKRLIASLEITSQPVPPDDAIGRLTRMEAISSKSISDASLNSARTKLVKLETALEKVDRPDFGVCIRCENPIPWGRIKVMPENALCVPCAEKR